MMEHRYLTLRSPLLSHDVCFAYLQYTQVHYHCQLFRIPTAGLEALIGGRFHCLKRSTDNFFVGMGLGRVNFPLRVRLTSISGEQVEAFIPDLKNDFSYPSNIQYSGIKVGGKSRSDS
jgi:expansin (peptidoglycan-binding protein)